MSWKPPHWLALVIASMACWLERQAGAQIEYLKAENRALRSRLAGRRVLFTDAGRRTLGALANEIGTTALRELNPIVVAGERDAVKLAKLLDGRIRASEEDIVNPCKAAGVQSICSPSSKRSVCMTRIKPRLPNATRN